MIDVPWCPTHMIHVSDTHDRCANRRTLLPRRTRKPLETGSTVGASTRPRGVPHPLPWRGPGRALGRSPAQSPLQEIQRSAGPRQQEWPRGAERSPVLPVQSPSGFDSTGMTVTPAPEYGARVIASPLQSHGSRSHVPSVHATAADPRARGRARERSLRERRRASEGPRVLEGFGRRIGPAFSHAANRSWNAIAALERHP
jgi:hypothetical protein